MKYLLLPILLFNCQFLNAQVNDSTRVLDQWQFGVNLSPDMCYRELYDQTGMNQGIISYRDLWEEPKFGFTLGVNAHRILNTHFSLTFGLHYSNKGYKMEMEQAYYETPSSSPEIVSYKTLYNMHYIDLPFGLNVSLGKKDLRFSGNIGVATNLFLFERDKNWMRFDNREEQSFSKSQDDIKRLGLTPFIGAGVSYALNERTTIYFEPTIRVGLTKIIDTPITARLFSAGVNLSYFMRF